MTSAWYSAGSIWTRKRDHQSYYLEFQRTLTDCGIQLSVIFLSGHGDISMSVKAIKSGAIEFLTKPVHEQELLDAVQAGIARDPRST